MSDGVPAAGSAGSDGGSVPGVALDGAPSAASSLSLPPLPPPLDSELTADDLEILCALPDNDADDAAASSADASALPASPEPSQAPAAESSPLLLGQELSSEMSGASDPWLPTPSPHEDIVADADANPTPAYGEGDRGRDSLSTPSPSPHNDHSYTAPASPAETTADEGENVGADGASGNRESVGSKNVGGQENVGVDGKTIGADGKTIGADGKTVGADEKTVGTDDGKTVGADEKTVGADGKTVGADGQNVGADGQNVGADRQNVGADGQNVGVDGQNVVVDGLKIGVDRENVGVDGVNVGVDGVNVGVDGVNVGVDGVNVGVDRENVGVDRENVGVDGENVGVGGENVGSDGIKKPLHSDSLLRHAGEGEAADAAVDGDDAQPGVHGDAPPNAADELAKSDELHLPASAEAAVAAPTIAMEVDDDESDAIAADDESDAIAAVPPGKAPGPVVSCEPAGGALTSPNLSTSTSAAEGRRSVNRREADERRLVIDEGPGVSTRRSQARVGVSTRRSGSSDLRSSATAADGRSPASAAQGELRKSASDGQFACDQCERSFDKEVNLRRHVSNAHSKQWLKGNPSSRQAGDTNEAGPDGASGRIVRYVCRSCRRSFRGLIELHLHRKSCGIVSGHVPSNGPTACSTCGRRCVSAIALLRHLQSHRSKSHGQRRAPKSSQASSSRSASQPQSANSSSKARAAATAAAPATFECRRCGDSLPDMKSFIVHMETHSSEPAPYECSPTTERHSGSGDRDAEDRDGTAESVGDASSASHLCDQCGRTFRCPDRLQMHIKRHEAAEAADEGTDEDEDDEGDSEPRLCEKCGQEVSSAELLERHMATAHGDDVEANEEVGVGGNVGSAVCMVKVEAPEPQLDAKQNGDGRDCMSQPSVLECPSCSARCATELELKRHLLKHRPPSSATVAASAPAGQARGVCKEATKLPSATTTGLRQSAGQMRANDPCGGGEKRRELQCRRCDRRFSHGCSLRRHELAEHVVGSACGSLGALPTCHKCGRQFRARQRLREHLASVHSRPSPSCSVCGLRFTSAARLCWHVERRHGDTSDERRPQQRRSASRPSPLVASGSVNRHLQQRMYRCRHCVARFKHAQQLWLHSLRRHSPDITRTGLGVVRGLEICGKAGKTLPLHRLTMWHSCLHCLARYRQLESLWRHTRLSHRDRLVDVDGTPLLPFREPRSLQGDGGGGNGAKLGSPSAARGGSSSSTKLPVVAVAAPVHAAFVSTAEQSKQLIARNFKIAPGGRASLAAQLKPQTTASHDPKPSTGSSNPTAADENRRYTRRDQPVGVVQRLGSLRNENTTSNKPAPIGETLRRAETADATKCGAVGGSRPVGTRATSASNSIGSPAFAIPRPVVVVVGGGGAVAAAAQQQEQQETQFYSAAGRALRRSVLQRAAKATDYEKSAGTPVALSSTAAHSGSDSSESSPGGSSSKQTLSAATAASRRPLTATVMPTLRQQAMCLWCEATFPRLAMLAEHACVHREDLQKMVLGSISKRT